MLWRVFEARLGERVRSYVRNIALLRISAEDARADQKMQGIDKDSDEVIDTYALGDQGEDGSGIRDDGGDADVQDYYDAFIGVLAAVRESEIKDMPVCSALKCLDGEARAVAIGCDTDTMTQRNQQFYTMLQDAQDTPLRGLGLLSSDEINAISKIQKKEDANITASIQGKESDRRSATT